MQPDDQRFRRLAAEHAIEQALLGAAHLVRRQGLGTGLSAQWRNDGEGDDQKQAAQQRRSRHGEYRENRQRVTIVD